MEVAKEATAAATAKEAAAVATAEEAAAVAAAFKALIVATFVTTCSTNPWAGCLSDCLLLPLPGVRTTAELLQSVPRRVQLQFPATTPLSTSRGPSTAAHLVIILVEVPKWR